MRPKRRILLYCGNEDRLSQMTFVLETRGYAVAACDTVAAARGLATRGYNLALLIENGPQPSLDGLAGLLMEMMPEMPVMVFGGLRKDIETGAVFRVAEESGMNILLALLRLRTKLKRGPKKARRQSAATGYCMAKERAA